MIPTTTAAGRPRLWSCSEGSRAVFSYVIRAALEAEVVGQRPAVHTVVRGATRLLSGLTPRERRLGAFLFVGPTGTGKSHLVQTASRVLGVEARTAVIDCREIVHGDPRMQFATQAAGLFVSSLPGFPWGNGTAPSRPVGLEPAADGACRPFSILQIDHPERGHPDVTRVLATALDTGRVPLPNGSSGSLDNCLVFVTSGLCSAEILDEAPTIGFSGAPDDEQRGHKDELRDRCLVAARDQFGADLIGRLDDFEIFHRLREEDLRAILDLRADRLDHWLLQRGCGVQLEETARSWLVEKGSRDLRVGARELLRVLQEQVDFPLADLIVSGHVPPGSTVLIDRRGNEEHLHFTVERSLSPATRSLTEIAID